MLDVEALDRDVEVSKVGEEVNEVVEVNRVEEDGIKVSPEVEAHLLPPMPTLAKTTVVHVVIVDEHINQEQPTAQPRGRLVTIAIAWTITRKCVTRSSRINPMQPVLSLLLPLPDSYQSM